jgi:PAS domain-containing protein
MMFVAAPPAQAEAACKAHLAGVRGRAPVSVYIGTPTVVQLERLLRAGVDAITREEDVDLAIAVAENAARDRALVADLMNETRESDERHQSILALIREGVLVADRAGKTIACNDAAVRILGRTR